MSIRSFSLRARRFGAAILGGLAAVCFGELVAAEPRASRPNVLVILSDDQGFGDVGFNGNTKLDTPVLDRLAADGARLDRFYVSPVCSPTRAALLSGKYPQRVGVTDVAGGREFLSLDTPTLADLFRGGGYATGIIGKWHNGSVWPYTPLARGFDEFYGFDSGGSRLYWRFDNEQSRNGVPEIAPRYTPDVHADEAIRFIERHRDRPFFCYLAFNVPHEPNQVPDRYHAKYAARGFNDYHASVYGMVDNMDENIGRVLARLEELGLEKNTLVLFLSDNGPKYADGGPRYNAGLLGTKGGVLEGGMRVPCVIRWPGRIRPGTVVMTPTAHIDVLPTLVEACGLGGMPADVDGRSMLPLLDGSGGRWPERMLFESLFGYEAVRQGELLLVRGPKPPVRLWNVASDPGQRSDIAPEQPEKVAELLAALDEQRTQMEPFIRSHAPALPVGDPKSPRTVLHQHLARIDNLERDTPWQGVYLKPWTRADGFANWDLNVVRAGRYRISLDARCAPEAVGSLVRAELAGRSAELRMFAPAEPAPIHARHHHPAEKRGVFLPYVTLWVGDVVVPAGRATLRLSVPELSPGGTGPVVWGMRVEWMNAE